MSVKSFAYAAACFGVSAILLGSSPRARAEEAAAPKPKYSLNQEQPTLGTRIIRDQTSRSAVAINLPYEQLPEAERAALHSWWEHIEDGDEPPFPRSGLQAIYDPMRKVGDKLPADGRLFVVAMIGPQGRATEVQIYDAPSKKVGEAAAAILLVTDFKPALCSGKPCYMEFPLRMYFKPAH